jgi:hypothetical protein
MPTISRFYGILIQMYYKDHNPPHFHAIYNVFKAVISIYDYSVLEGDLPPKALGLIMEWTKFHQKDLLRDWELAKNMKELFPIDPLE